MLGVEGADGVCSKRKLPTTHNHHCRYRRHRRRRRRHHHLFFQILLEVLIAARVIFKRWNPGAAEKGAEEVYLAHRHLPGQNPRQTHACPHAYP